MARILGIDYGHRRLGFALSDPTEMLATPHSVVEVKSEGEAVEAAAGVCEETGAARMLVGLPLRTDGTRGDMVEAVEAFSERLRERSGLPVDTWDERFTSKIAEDVLIEAGTRRKKRRQVIDKLAAQIMLQHYLDAQGGGDAAWEED